jgi:SprT-like protein
MEDRELQQWVERVSLESFDVPFRHKATFNSRLRSTGGRYFPRTHNIEISSLQLEMNGPDEVDKIIKHELCHYHLHLGKKGYQHRDADFRTLLKQVGGARFCRTLPIVKRRESVKYQLVCLACGMTYPRKRKLDPRRYACSQCRGKLKLIAL